MNYTAKAFTLKKKKNNELKINYCITGFCVIQIAREMVISPRNSRLGFATLVKRVGMLDQPDNPDGELIKYKVLFLLCCCHFFFKYMLLFS